LNEAGTRLIKKRVVVKPVAQHWLQAKLQKLLLKNLSAPDPLLKKHVETLKIACCTHRMKTFYFVLVAAALLCESHLELRWAPATCFCQEVVAETEYQGSGAHPNLVALCMPYGDAYHTRSTTRNAGFQRAVVVRQAQVGSHPWPVVRNFRRR
jgi:hypothetical protein